MCSKSMGFTRLGIMRVNPHYHGYVCSRSMRLSMLGTIKFNFHEYYRQVIAIIFTCFVFCSFKYFNQLYSFRVLGKSDFQ